MAGTERFINHFPSGRAVRRGHRRQELGFDVAARQRQQSSAAVSSGRLEADREGHLRGQAGDRRPGPARRAHPGRTPRPRPHPARVFPASRRRWPSRLSRRSSAAPSRVQFTPTSCPPTSSAPASTGRAVRSSTLNSARWWRNFLLADEINRAPAKVQSALLEVMAERQVSIGGVTYPMPKPFLVMATQNPIENEGVYPLPEAQRDLPVQSPRRLPVGRGGARDRVPDGQRPADGLAQVLDPRR